MDKPSPSDFYIYKISRWSWCQINKDIKSLYAGNPECNYNITMVRAVRGWEKSRHDSTANSEELKRNFIHILKAKCFVRRWNVVRFSTEDHAQKISRLISRKERDMIRVLKTYCQRWRTLVGLIVEPLYFSAGIEPAAVWRERFWKGFAVEVQQKCAPRTWRESVDSRVRLIMGLGRKKASKVGGSWRCGSKKL